MSEFVWGLTGKLLALGLLASLFYVLYRYALARTLSRRALILVSLIATVLFELARWAFNWYVAFAHETLTLYGLLGGLMFFSFGSIPPHWSLFFGAKWGLLMNKPVCAELAQMDQHRKY